MITNVEGIDDTAIDINQLAKILKGASDSGGTVRDGPLNFKESTRSVHLRF